MAWCLVKHRDNFTFTFTFTSECDMCHTFRVDWFLIYFITLFRQQRWEGDHEWWVGEDLEEGSHGIFEGNSPGETLNTCQDRRDPAKIWTRSLPNESLEPYYSISLFGAEP
jgi:hypothetical protein